MPPTWSETDTHWGLRLVSSAAGSPPLLLLHGVTRRWQTYLPLLGPLAARRQLHLLDARGHGASTRGWPRYLVTDYVDDTVDVVRRHWDQPLAVYGHSLGAMTALGVAAACPDRVTALILEDPPFHTMGLGISQTRLHSYFDGLWQLLQQQPSLEELRRQLPDLCYVDPLSGESWRVDQLKDQAAIRFAAWCLHGLEAKVLEPIPAGQWLDGWDWTALLPLVQCPVLVLQADPQAGGMLSDEDAAMCAAELADVSLIRWPHVGHVIHELRPMELAAKVLGFLETTV